ncbi:MAG: hypothetical protein ACK42C_04105 [Aquificaceae bacterium]|jgi:hypothetical protein|uniref:hypothetical protein n=1 Tax=Hydrogenobacter sp. Uz 6-8 TaxID=3384828 RepID=UPI0030AD93E8
MRVRFRVAVYDKQGNRVNKEDLVLSSGSLYRGLRYVTEFKYLEATKWLMLAEDCQEKYLLLGLLNISLGQTYQGLEFLQEAMRHTKTTQYVFAVEKPEEGLRFFIEKPEASLPDFLLSL